jgi:hypothetical protein
MRVSPLREPEHAVGAGEGVEFGGGGFGALRVVRGGDRAEGLEGDGKEGAEDEFARP